jgi:hypothetical protein
MQFFKTSNRIFLIFFLIDDANRQQTTVWLYLYGNTKGAGCYYNMWTLKQFLDVNA